MTIPTPSTRVRSTRAAHRTVERSSHPSAGTSWASTPAIRKTMQGCRSRDTVPEVALWSAVHSLGLRFFVNRRPIPGMRLTADLVFPTHRVAVFMDGCFWHGCPDHYDMPVRNAAFWRTKINSNRARDRKVDGLLASHGWRVVRIWEHVPPSEAAERVYRVIAED